MIGTEPGAPPDTGLDEFATWRRVDGRTPVIYALPVLAVGAWLLAAGLLSASVPSTPGVPGAGVGAGGGGLGGFAVEALLPVASVVAVIVRWLTGRYAIVDGAVRWKVGLLVHRATDIGLDRIQDVEVTRPLLARLMGLAQVTVSSAGGAGEIKLQYLDQRVAERLGHLLQHRIALERHAAATRGVPTAPVGGVAPPTAPAPAVGLHQVTPGELARWAACRAWPAVPIGVIAVVVAALVDWRAALPLLPMLPFWGIGLAKPVADRVGLAVSIDATSLSTSAGLTTVRRTSTQRERIQLVSGHQLWVQRLRGRETVRFASADVTLDQKEGSVRQELALDVPVDTWGTMAATIAHRQVIGPAWLRPKPVALSLASTWRWAITGVVAGVIGGSIVGVVVAVGDGPAVVAGLGVLVGLALAGTVGGAVRGRSRRRVEGWAVTPDDLLVRRGVLRRTTLLLFAHKTQAIEVLAGPVQRRLGLATVVVDVAPPGREHRVVVHDLLAEDAVELAASLTRSGSVPLPDGV